MLCMLLGTFACTESLIHRNHITHVQMFNVTSPLQLKAPITHKHYNISITTYNKPITHTQKPHHSCTNFMSYSSKQAQLSHGKHSSTQIHPLTTRSEFVAAIALIDLLTPQGAQDTCVWPIPIASIFFSLNQIGT